MKPAMKTNHMWSVPRPAKSQSKYKKKEQVNFHQMDDDKSCQSTKFIKPVYEDQKCQSTVCFDKNCQVNMQQVMPEMNIQSKEPQSSFKKKHVPLCSDQSCQSTRCYKNLNTLKANKSYVVSDQLKYSSKETI